MPVGGATFCPVGESLYTYWKGCLICEMFELVRYYNTLLSGCEDEGMVTGRISIMSATLKLSSSPRYTVA